MPFNNINLDTSAQGCDYNVTMVMENLLCSKCKKVMALSNSTVLDLSKGFTINTPIKYRYLCTTEGCNTETLSTELYPKEVLNNSTRTGGTNAATY